MHGNRAAPQWSRRCAIALTVLAATACEASSQTAPIPTRATGDVLRGQRLLAQYQCGSCHAIPGVPIARGAAGPSLEQFGRRTYIAGHIPNRADKLMQWLIDPRSLVPNTTMPNMGVSQDDARDMAAYLQSLR
jgi:cytochrome c